MKKILILYTSKYGSTERYAKLLQEELGKDCDVTIAPLKSYRGKCTGYDKIIYGAGIKSYKMYNYPAFARKVKNIDRDNTEIVVFAVGMMSATKSYANRLVSINGIEDDMKFFYLRGAIDLAKLKGFDGSIVKNLVRTLMVRDDLTEDEKAFVSACLHTKDWVNMDNAMRIVEYIR